MNLPVAEPGTCADCGTDSRIHPRRWTYGKFDLCRKHVARRRSFANRSTERLEAEHTASES